MNIRHLLWSAATALAMLLIAAAPGLPTHIYAQSPSDRVWVVQNLTSQAHCLRNGIPCPAGAVVVFHVYQIDQATAAAQHRVYISANVSRADLLNWVHAQEALAYPAPPRTIRPYITCMAHMPQQDHISETLANIHSTISATMTYNVFATCFRQAISLAQTVTSGPETYQDGTIYVEDWLGNIYDSDGAGWSCIGLPHTANFGGNIISTVNPLHTAVQYSSGSACTYFGDTFDDVNYLWSQ